MPILLIIYKVDGERHQDEPATVYCRIEERTEIKYIQTKKIH